MISIGSYDEFASYLGQEIGVSGWHKVTQEQINKFADATLDHQWIHVDEVKAAAESPFKATIAHGYLTLSLVPSLWQQIVKINNLKMEINYGVDNLKFAQPVIVNSEIRLKTTLKSIINLRGTSKVVIEMVMEIKDQNKPAFTGEAIFLYHFNS